MAAVGRNQPCPCGSGSKAKRCCGIRRGPSLQDLARAFVAEQRRLVTPVLRPVLGDVDAMVELLEAVAELPQLDLSCQLRLPRLLSPVLDRLRTALVDDDPEEVEAALPAAIAEVDTPVVRADLARAVLSLRAAGRISEMVAAAALIDLDGPDGLVCEALLAALAVDGGVTPTPAGLILVG